MASGLVQLAASPRNTFELISATFADGSSAFLIILAISFGLIVPKMAIDNFRITDQPSTIRPSTSKAPTHRAK
jgi:hypothetical protein